MKFKGIFATALLSAVILGACGTSADADTDNGNTGAELSGNLTVYLPSPAGLADDLIAMFQQQTGIAVDQFQGTTGQILARLEAEAANPIADVVILASWSDGMELRQQGLLHAFTPELASQLHADFVSDDNTMFGTSASAVGIAYNTLLFDSMDADWADLANAEFHDQLAFPDPELSGSAKDFLAGFMYNNQENGWATWQSLADNGMIVPGANAAALESVVTGERGILVSGVDWNIFNAIAQGEPLNFYYPAGG
ncbi:MAG: extracellular solute-binding protein, partial [Turicibacter sp.]|nr:extracellular solute-binding protein [Turicibacter sp.]